jgi:hypothetical protein
MQSTTAGPYNVRVSDASPVADVSDAAGVVIPGGDRGDGRT